MKIITIIGAVALLAVAAWVVVRPSAPQAAPVEGSITENYSGTVATTTPVEPAAQPEQGPITQTNKKPTTVKGAIFTTTKGSITLEFLGAQAPKTVENFTKLASSGFYNGVKFHRVIDGFMIQGGDPLTKDDAKMDMWGTGGPGYSFADELYKGNHNGIGTISMANAGPNTNGSQFFINVADNGFLDGKHVVFGKVTAGIETVQAISKVKTGAADRPVEPVVIESITLLTE